MRAEVLALLDRSPWRDATVTPLAGDASHRRYARLTGGPTPALLMDADPALGEDVEPFMRIGGHLRDAGLPCPEIFAADTSAGAVLLEDFGGVSLADALTASPGEGAKLYADAAAHLVTFAQAAPPPGLGRWSSAEMAPLADLAVTWYAPDRPSPSPSVRAALAPFDDGPRAFVHRDYHVENLMLRAGHDGPARLGVIDFQDGALGHPAYDLASLIDDVRRDTPDDIRAACIAQVRAGLALDEDTLGAALAAHSAQRALRILGVFARLRIRDGKPRYLGFLPRTWAILTRACAHPHLAELRRHVAELPPPTPEHIIAIERRCPIPA
ncbi:MAG: aminoglycoside phosphotransferase family protein [Shimia sp.]